VFHCGTICTLYVNFSRAASARIVGDDQEKRIFLKLHGDGSRRRHICGALYGDGDPSRFCM